MFCCLPVVYVLGCVLVREDNKNRQFFTGTYKIGLMQRNPGNRLTHSQRKKTLSACRASYRGRIELKPRPTCPDGLPVSAYLSFCRKVLVRRDTFERRRIFHNDTYPWYTYIRRGCSQMRLIRYCAPSLTTRKVRDACYHTPGDKYHILADSLQNQGGSHSENLGFGKVWCSRDTALHRCIARR